MRPPQRSRLAWGLFGLTAALLVTALLLGLGVDNVVLFPVTLSLGLVGAVISARTGNRVGWLFVADGVVLGLCLVTEAYASGPHAAARPGAAWAGWAFTILLEVGTIGFFLIPLLFPDGRPPSPRWWPVVWLQIAVGLFGVALVSFSAVNFPANFPHLRDPVIVLSAPALAAFYSAKQYLQALFFVVSAAAVIVRLVRSSGEERLQLKWFTYAAALAALALPVAVVLIPQPVIAFAVFFPLIPAAAGVAIMKYRLYDIDVVISKTIVYGSLAAFITAVRAIHVSGPNENRPRDAVVRDSPPPRILWLVRSDEYPQLPYTSLLSSGSAPSDQVPCTLAPGPAWACRSWPPRWWRWPSSRSGSGCSTWPTGWCSASGPPLTRRSATSPGGWAVPTPPKTCCPGWPGSWPKAPVPATRWCG